MRLRIGKTALLAMLIGLYLFLYAPIVYIAYVSFQQNSVWPFPPSFTLANYESLVELRDYKFGLINSLIIGVGTGVGASFLASAGAIGVLRYPIRERALIAGFFLAPLFIAHILIGISSLMFNRAVLGLSGNLLSAILANMTYATAFAFLVMLAQLVRYDWRLDEAEMVFGARPLQTFLNVTLPLVWPAILGAFIVSFLLAFNNLEISFYNLGAVPTLPTLAWGELRHGISEELYALAALLNATVFILLGVLFLLLRTGFLKIDFRD
jgi:ABC-type spermidine/putrescine transport system permease subunit II